MASGCYFLSSNLLTALNCLVSPLIRRMICRSSDSCKVSLTDKHSFAEESTLLTFVMLARKYASGCNLGF